MKRKKAPRHKLLNEILMQKKCGKHEDKAWKQQKRAKMKEQGRQLIMEDV